MNVAPNNRLPARRDMWGGGAHPPVRTCRNADMPTAPRIGAITSLQSSALMPIRRRRRDLIHRPNNAYSPLRHLVRRDSVRRAYAELTRLHLIRSVQGSGYYATGFVARNETAQKHCYY